MKTLYVIMLVVLISCSKPPDAPRGNMPITPKDPTAEFVFQETPNDLDANSQIIAETDDFLVVSYIYSRVLYKLVFSKNEPVCDMYDEIGPSGSVYIGQLDATLQNSQSVRDYIVKYAKLRRSLE